MARRLLTDQLLKASQRSPYRFPGSKDTGQRYVIRYTNGINQRCTFGYADDVAHAEQQAASCRQNRMFTKVKIIDRSYDEPA